jgi:hypothetical protein
MATERKFKTGDRVLVTSVKFGLFDKKAIIKGYRAGFGYAVEVDGYFGGHDCYGMTVKKAGLWLTAQNLTKDVSSKTPITPVPEPKKETGCKFSVGDKVMFKYFDDMLASGCSLHKGMSNVIEGPDGKNNLDMDIRKHIQGRTAIIANVTKNSNGTYSLTLKDWSNTSGSLSWSYYDWMLRLVEKAKVAPKKKLTVAEVEKLLGYGVEVVKG